MKNLKYSDETDRSLGISGMAIALFACDGEEYLASVSLDAPTGRGLALAPEFHFAGNPRLSAKSVWNQLLKQFELLSAMVMANVMCRCYVGHGKRPDFSQWRDVKNFVADQGRDLCQLDDDEISTVCSKTEQFLDRLFSHGSVVDVARTFSRRLIDNRTMTSAEVLDFLSQLR